MDIFTESALLTVAKKYGTPGFVYFAGPIRARVRQLRQEFDGRFEVSFAVKSNPNIGLLGVLQKEGISLDVSSIGEFSRGLEAGFAASQISFTGPAKRLFEIEIAVRSGIGEMICESLDEMEQINKVASELDLVQRVLVRINPKETPKKFGLQMSGRPSQFGIDEEDMGEVPTRIAGLNSISVSGFHIFSGGNSLNEEAIVENLGLTSKLFTEFSDKFDLTPETLVFGSGFGIPYFEGDKEISMAVIAVGLNAMIDRLKQNKRFVNTKFVLEIGRWLVGSDGYMLTSIIGEKRSRGTDICLCDAGFNNNLSAAGMMGTIMRRDWKFWNLSSARTDENEGKDYLLVGPLCASFDVLGAKVNLPETSKGDILAVGSSGAYGVTASPTRFISHPEPQEFIVENKDDVAIINDVTESQLNTPADASHLPPKI